MDRNPLLPKLFIFTGNRILITGLDPPAFPGRELLDSAAGAARRSISLELEHEGHSFTAVSLTGTGSPAEDISLPVDVRPVDLRTLAFTADPEVFALVSKAFQVLYWEETHRYCGRCRGVLQSATEGFSKRCPDCGLHIFPQIAPAIIIGVVRDGKLLLAHNVRFPEGIYSLVAGFLDPGETITQCAKREVMEETGIEVEGIRFFGSQPWPFPHSLMIGLIGDYAGGEIAPDGEEISDAKWFAPRELPRIPGRGSISRRIIDWFIDTYS
jgi:NAD+ diphosphatase